MNPNLLRIALGPKLSASVREVPHQLLLLGIHRDDWLTLLEEAPDLAVDMLKLSMRSGCEEPSKVLAFACRL